MSSALASRITTGGISKRGGTRRTRVDNDGDLDMDAPGGANRNRNNRRGGKGGGGGGSRAGAGRSINLNNTTKGSAAERRKGAGSGAGRDTRRDPVGTRNAKKGALSHGNNVPVKVEGWKATQRSAEECVKFLERKTKLKFPQFTTQGEALIIYVPPSKVQSVVDWDNARFAGAHLKLSSQMGDNIVDIVMDQLATGGSTKEIVSEHLGQVLANRYHGEDKRLDLSNLGTDMVLQQAGLLAKESTAAKVFPALMAIADQKFDTPAQKRELVHVITIESNHLPSVHPVNALAPTFPDITSLSLANNNIADFKALDPWKNKFRKLEHLILMGNPVAQAPDYRDEIARRYPKLVTLDNIPVDRTNLKPARGPHGIPASKVDASGRAVLPRPTKPNLIYDNEGAGMQFLATFFSAYDTNRDQLIAEFYTPISNFSLSVNTSAPRVEALSNARQYWDEYIPLSRNLKRMRDVTGSGFERLAVGHAEIKAMWDKLPRTRHNLEDQSLWSFDIFPTMARPTVPGLLIMVHGEFDEDNKLSKTTLKRSFDRTFIIVMVDGKVKVADDMLVIRSHSGSEGWKVDPAAIAAADQEEQQRAQREAQQLAQQQVMQQSLQQTGPPQPMAPVQPTPVGPATTTPQDAAQPTPEQMAELENRVNVFAETTGLKIQYSRMCLEAAGWDLAAAWDQLTNAKQQGTVVPDMFSKNHPIFNP